MHTSAKYTKLLLYYILFNKAQGETPKSIVVQLSLGNFYWGGTIDFIIVIVYYCYVEWVARSICDFLFVLISHIFLLLAKMFYHRLKSMCFTN